MKNVSITNAWTGLNNIGANNLQWSDGTPYTFESFRKGEPNGDHEHCVAFEGNRWNDARCAASYYYVCKKRGEWIHRWGGGGGWYSTKFIRGGLTSKENATLPHTLHRKWMVPFHMPTVGTLHLFPFRLFEIF